MVFNFMIKSMGKLLQWPSIYRIAPILKGFPGSSVGKESACKAGDPGVQFLGWEDPLEKGMATHSSVLAWSPPGSSVHGVARVGRLRD